MSMIGFKPSAATIDVTACNVLQDQYNNLENSVDRLRNLNDRLESVIYRVQGPLSPSEQPDNVQDCNPGTLGATEEELNQLSIALSNLDYLVVMLERL